MEKTAAELRAEGEALIAAGNAKITEAQKAEAATMQAQPPAISPRTQLPVEHPESQAVERIHHEIGQSFCGQPASEAAIKNLLEKKPKKQ
jgi:hypothetical protein